jgi:hypothetical protein
MNESDYASVGLVFFLFAIFCAYWAQMNNRSSWGWFFFGFFLAPIAGLVLLHENSKLVT